MTLEVVIMIALIIAAILILWLLTEAYNSPPYSHTYNRTTEDEDSTIPTVVGLSMLLGGDDEE